MFLTFRVIINHSANFASLLRPFVRNLMIICDFFLEEFVLSFDISVFHSFITLQNMSIHLSAAFFTEHILHQRCYLSHQPLYFPIHSLKNKQTLLMLSSPNGLQPPKPCSLTRRFMGRRTRTFSFGGDPSRYIIHIMFVETVLVGLRRRRFVIFGVAFIFKCYVAWRMVIFVGLLVDHLL